MNSNESNIEVDNEMQYQPGDVIRVHGVGVVEKVEPKNGRGMHVELRLRLPYTSQTVTDLSEILASGGSTGYILTHEVQEDEDEESEDPSQGTFEDLSKE